MSDPLATRLSLRLAPMPSRVVAQLFVPGHALGGGTDGRASRVVDDVVSMDDSDVATVLETIAGRFAARHRDLDATLRHHAERLANRLAPGCELSAPRKLLLGATFTHEYSVEAAALCNPSAVVAPDQSDLRPGTVRFVLSVRQIGEGHRSSIGFRTGILDDDGAVSIEDPGPFATAGTIEEATLDATTFQAATDHRDASQWLLARLGPRFTPSDLAARLHQLEAQSDTRRDVPATVRRLRQLADRHYRVSFPPSSRLDERVLSPATEAESNGLEDARFVRFVELDGTVTYYATYTAYNGSAIVQQLLATADFVTFTSTPLLGPAAANKGLALFPRRIGGRFYAMSRFDGATNAVTCSNDLGVWTDATPLDVDISGWQLVQVGNCGSPIELDEGWLVLTHGVGPLRTYSIGALLLDLDDPSVVIGQSRQPLLTPQRDEQDGYVPNVVYSCGSLRHGDVLLVPFGIADANIGFATFSIDDIVATMDAPAPQQPRHNTERGTDA
jgi:predicted GH43/DUF377 family glycosyl hydrolase